VGAPLNGVLVPTFHLRAPWPTFVGPISTRIYFSPFSSFVNLILDRATSIQARFALSVAHSGTHLPIDAFLKMPSVPIAWLESRYTSRRGQKGANNPDDPVRAGILSGTSNSRIRNELSRILNNGRSRIYFLGASPHRCNRSSKYCRRTA
jgi:hypothetical protein